MAVYRFRVAFEDREEIYRDIEIKSTQTFEDFHFIILNSIGFDTVHNASFFISDDYWRKGEEIIFRNDDPVSNKLQVKTLPPIKEMRKCRMVSLIDDPHQKFLYAYDPKVQWTFLIELMKITADDDKLTYPRIVKSVEDAPRQYNILNVPAAVEEEYDGEDIDDTNDDEAYKVVHDEDDLGALEGEEGEEDAAIEEDERGEAGHDGEPAEEEFE
jgi:hypothetical protein